MRSFLFVLLSVVVLSCGTLYVQTDVDESFNIEDYQTYNYDLVQTGLNQLDERRFIRFTDSNLIARGFQKTETPQLYITLFTEDIDVPSDTNLGVGIGGGGNVGVSIGGSIPVGGSKLQQQMTVKLWDVAQNKLLWEAYAEGSKRFNMSPSERTKYMKKWVSKIFKKLPTSQN